MTLENCGTLILEYMYQTNSILYSDFTNTSSSQQILD